MPIVTVDGKKKHFPYSVKGRAAAKVAKAVSQTMKKKKRITSDGYMK